MSLKDGQELRFVDVNFLAQALKSLPVSGAASLKHESNEMLDLHHAHGHAFKGAFLRRSNGLPHERIVGRDELNWNVFNQHMLLVLAISPRFKPFVEWRKRHK